MGEDRGLGRGRSLGGDRSREGSGRGRSMREDTSTGAWEGHGHIRDQQHGKGQEPGRDRILEWGRSLYRSMGYDSSIGVFEGH